ASNWDMLSIPRPCAPPHSRPPEARSLFPSQLTKPRQKFPTSLLSGLCRGWAALRVRNSLPKQMAPYAVLLVSLCIPRNDDQNTRAVCALSMPPASVIVVPVRCGRSARAMALLPRKRAASVLFSGQSAKPLALLLHRLH